MEVSTCIGHVSDGEEAASTDPFDMPRIQSWRYIAGEAGDYLVRVTASCLSRLATVTSPAVSAKEELLFRPF